MQLVTDDWTRWQVAEWQTWLNEQVQDRKTIFNTDPDEMTSAFNRERDSARDYHGRELLELLQNADDAGAEQQHNNKVLVKLDEDSLYVANTGQPFSPEGIKSLMVSNNSPKQLSRSHYIGYKGLGFRSVLGWASKVSIFSGTLAVGFSEENALAVGQQLSTQNIEIKKVVDKFLEITKAFPIATLSCPFWLGETKIAEENVQRLAKECRLIRNEGFDTCIGFKLKTPQVTRDKVLGQVQALGKELLVFSNYLESVEIRTPETSLIWKAIREENEVSISSGDSKQQSHWKVFSKTDSIPGKYIGEGQPKDMIYEIKVAVPDSGSGKDKLYVYFPTQVRFPFPIVAHATFELGSNRQNLIISDINKFLCDELASVMALAAAESVNPDQPWKGLLLVTPNGSIDPVLTEMGFDEKLKTQCEGKNIVPVRKGEFYNPSRAKSISGDFDQILVGDDFTDLCLFSDNWNVTNRLKYFEVIPISKSDLKERIEKLSYSLDLETRAKLIFKLVDNNLIDEVSAPTILVDDDGIIIPSAVTSFLPAEKSGYSLPPWVPIRFVNTKLSKLLQEEFGVSRIRDLVNQLKAFKVQEYNYASIVQQIVAEANRKVEKSPEKELNIRQEMLNAVLTLWERRTAEDAIDSLQRITFIIPTRMGGFKPAADLYFGREYKSGQLMEALLCEIAPESFVAAPVVLGLDQRQGNIEAFLKWLGVSDLPRLEKDTHVSNSDYRDYVLASLNYPVMFEDYKYQNSDDVKQDYLRIAQVQNIDKIQNILQRADPVAIVAWLSTDVRIDKLRIDGDTEAKLIVSPYRTKFDRSFSGNKIPSYAFWQLQHTKWVPTVTGKQPPIRCTLAHGLPPMLSKIIGTPNIDPENDLFKTMGIDKTSISRALLTVGTSSDIHDLSWDIYYEILLELPSLDPEGKIAKSLYRSWVGKEDKDIPQDNVLKARFFRDGKMFGRLGEKNEYFPISKLYYLDSFALLSHIETFFPCLDLDKRRGGKKVKRLFNVNSLTTEEVGDRLKVNNHEPHPGADAMRYDIDRMKPFIYALRFDGDADRSELPPLRRLEIRLCKSVTAKIQLDNGTQEVMLHQGESMKDGNITYLVAEPGEYDRRYLCDPLIADAVGEIISSIFKVDLNSDIARLISCPEKQLTTLLDRILGSNSEAKIAEARKLLESPVEAPDDFTYNPPLPGQYPPGGPSVTPTKQPVESIIPRTELPPNAVGPIAVTQKAVSPIEMGRRTRVKFIRSNNPKQKTSRVITNADRAENLVIEFEKEQKRYPIKVSELRGSEAYGCDILSFNDENARTVFMTAPNLSFIARFIEVKGSGLAKGSITLKGNELKSAQNNRDHFYLYRVFEDEDDRGSFELVETPNPLALDEKALELEYEVYPYRATTAQHWTITEI